MITSDYGERMELQHLRYFVAVAEEGSFTRAAETLRVSQSAASTQLRRLERDLGVRLLDRSNRHVNLTDAGTLLLPRARAVLAATEGIRATADEIRGLVRGTVRFGIVAGMTWPPAFDAVAQVHEHHPGLALTLVEDTSARLGEAVAHGEIDVAVLAWADAGRDDLEHQVLLSEDVAAVVSSTHELAARTFLTADDLADADLIALPVGTGSRTGLERFMRASGRRTHVRWEVSSPAAVGLLAGRGLGVGILTTSRADTPDDLVRVPLDPPTRSRLVVAWRDAARPATRVLLTALGAVADQGVHDRESAP